MHDMNQLQISKNKITTKEHMRPPLVSLDGASVQSLIDPGWEARQLRPVESRRVLTLGRQAPRTVELALEAGVKIEHLGIAPLFKDARFYPGASTDWVFAPANDEEGPIVPRSERQTLQRLVEADIDFPLIYVAHEIPKGRADITTPSSLDHVQAHELIGPVPAPTSVVQLDNRLSQRSAQILAGLARAVPIAGAIIAAPFLLVGAAVGSLATLDPIVIGAIPALSTEEGAPASWFVLARWDW